MFNLNQLSSAAQTEISCNALMQAYNDELLQLINTFKYQWVVFWDVNNSVEVMQAQLDQLAQTPATDLNTSTNALSAYFAKAVRLITFLIAEYPTAFADATHDKNGALMLGGSQPYQKYLTPGWIYTIDNTGRMIVSAPCQF